MSAGAILAKVTDFRHRGGISSSSLVTQMDVKVWEGHQPTQFITEAHTVSSYAFFPTFILI
jgi:hypothetical protein